MHVKLIAKCARWGPMGSPMGLSMGSYGPQNKCSSIFEHLFIKFDMKNVYSNHVFWKLGDGIIGIAVYLWDIDAAVRKTKSRQGNAHTSKNNETALLVKVHSCALVAPILHVCILLLLSMRHFPICSSSVACLIHDVSTYMSTYLRMYASLSVYLWSNVHTYIRAYVRTRSTSKMCSASMTVMYRSYISHIT